MPKITDEELEPIQLRLFQKDLIYLRSLYKDTVGVNKALRTIVRSFVNQTRAKTDAAIDDLETATEEKAMTQEDVDVLLGT